MWVALLGVSAAAIVATPIVVGNTRSDPDVGAVPATVRPGASLRPRTSGPTAGAIEPRPAIPTTASGPSPPGIVVRSALLQDYRPPRSPAPTSLRIDAIGLVAPVAAVGVEADGRSIEVPADVGTIGWYRFGPVPGADGSAVLLGHVDSHVQGAGAFFRLRELRPGDVVTVRFADDSRSSFRVVGRRSFPKDELPAELFQRSGRPVLTLVTCGGAFDETTRTYADNVVVFAVPAG
jgi:hypothetical protein